MFKNVKMNCIETPSRRKVKWHRRRRGRREKRRSTY
jgi:hypothetical protein